MFENISKNNLLQNDKLSLHLYNDKFKVGPCGQGTICFGHVLDCLFVCFVLSLAPFAKSSWNGSVPSGMLANG